MPFLTSAYGLKHNVHGVHLLAGANKSNIDRNLVWAHTLVGDGGHAKDLFSGVGPDTEGPNPAWIHFVNGCYERKLVPICRIASTYAGSYWQKPEPDAPGDYTSWANAIKRIAAGLPKKDGVPLYIEILNEPGVTIEWSGQPSATEYAHLLVDAARALRSLKDDRIVILNAGLSQLDAMFEAVPESVWAFDVLSSHPYPHGRPPEINNHDGTIDKPSDLAIDGYTLELEILKQYGRPKVPVIITETGYDLGNQTFAHLGYPIIDEDLRADYMMRAYRDFWSKWPELIAVTPFEFSNGGDWSRFDWVNPQSSTDEKGWPTIRYKQYDYAAFLAKPNDPTGAISGKILQTDLNVPVDGILVSCQPGSATFVTDVNGNYFFPKLTPGSYKLNFKKQGFGNLEDQVLVVSAGENTVLNTQIAALGLGSIKGLVLDGVTGGPVSGATITIRPGRRSVSTLKDGSFLIEKVIPSRYIVEATKAGFHFHRKKDVLVEDGAKPSLNFLISKSYYPLTRNLLRNVGFEEGDRAGLGIAWEIRSGKDYPDIYSMDTKILHTGDASQRIQANLKGINLIEQYTHYSTIEAGKSYMAGVWVRTRGIKRGSGRGVYLEASIFNNHMKGLGTLETEKPLDGDNDWTLMTLFSQAPPDSGRLRLTVFADAEEGTVWIDDAFAGEMKQ